jgi:uncharacterized protein (TIGR00270 family)
VQCEICGSDADRKAEIEGAVLNVCGSCSKYGTGIKIIEQGKTPKQMRLPDEMQIVFIENFSGAIKAARMKKRLSQEQLASAIKEKMSLVKRMEEGWKPPLQIARKLEKFLGISLLEKVRASAGKTMTGKGGITIGDIITVARKK